MISLEQVRQLDIRVKKAVSTVKTLTAENTELKQKITDLEAQISELTDEAEGRRASEQELEVSLQGVLDVLDEVDDETADIEPEAPTENYTIATVALTDESDGTESLEPEGSAISPEQPEPADEIDSPAESPAEDSGEESPASPAEIREIAESEPSDPDGEEQSPPRNGQAVETPASEQSTAQAVSEDVPGVGQVVEFERKSEESVPATAAMDDGQNESDAGAPADEAEDSEEDVALTEDDVAESDDEFQSEFDIF